MSIELPRREDHRPADALLREAKAKLAAARFEIPPSFVAQLYDHTVPEDLLRYAPEDLAELAAHAYSFLDERTPGRAKIRCEHVQLEASTDRNAAAVLEIVNDDMPFLL